MDDGESLEIKISPNFRQWTSKLDYESLCILWKFSLSHCHRCLLTEFLPHAIASRPHGECVIIICSLNGFLNWNKIFNLLIMCVRQYITEREIDRHPLAMSIDLPMESHWMESVHIHSIDSDSGSISVWFLVATKCAFCNGFALDTNWRSHMRCDGMCLQRKLPSRWRRTIRSLIVEHLAKL